jgi:hypothetical protein
MAGCVLWSAAGYAQTATGTGGPSSGTVNGAPTGTQNGMNNTGIIPPSSTTTGQPTTGTTNSGTINGAPTGTQNGMNNTGIQPPTQPSPNGQTTAPGPHN